MVYIAGIYFVGCLFSKRWPFSYFHAFNDRARVMEINEQLLRLVAINKVYKTAESMQALVKFINDNKEFIDWEMFPDMKVFKPTA
jgi:hypothetical protein